jgi:hypothetical protein
MGIPDHKLRFARVATYFFQAGYRVLDPHEIEPYCGPAVFDKCQDVVRGRQPVPNGLHSWQCFLRADIRDMLDCDAVVMLAGWAGSQGAKLEFHVALSCGMPVYNETGEFGMTEY